MSPNVLFEFGEQCRKNKNIKKAKDYYLEAIKKDPEHQYALIRLGECFSSEENHEQAFEYYLKAIEIIPQSANVLLELGNYIKSLDTEEKYKKAIDSYAKTLELFRKSISIQTFYEWKNIGYCYRHILGNLSEAKYCYKKFSNNNPDAKQRFESYKIIFEIDNKDIENLEKLGDCYNFGEGVEKDTDIAIKYYLEVINFIDMYMYKDDEDAIKFYKKVLELTTDDTQRFRIYIKLSELDTDNANYWEQLGDCYLDGKGTEQSYILARKFYEKVIEQNPNNANVLKKLGDCYSYGNLNIQKAIDYYNSAIIRNVEIYYSRSYQYFTYEEKSIFHCYKRINKIDPENFDALYYLGLCYKNGIGTKVESSRALGCFKRASELAKDEKKLLLCYKTIFELSPNDSVNCEKIVDYYLDKNTEKNIEEYIVYYKKYTEIGSYKNKKIQCCKKIIEKETDKIEVFEYRVKLSEFDSTDADNWKELGDCYLDIGIDKYKAIDCYKEFCKLSKDNGKRFNYYEKIYELNSQDIKNLVNLADSYRYGNGIEISVSKAIAFYKKAIDCTSDYEIKILLYEQINELDTTDTYVIEKLAEYYCTKGKISYYKKAYLQYKKLTELDSNSANYWEQLGICYEYGLGTERNNNEAINCYKKVIKLEMDYGHKQKFCEKIIELNPNDTYALNNLGDLWYKKGNKNKASEFYEKVIEIDPNYVRSYYGLKNCYNGEKKFECLLKIHELNPDDNIIELFYTDIECLEKLGDCYNYGIGTEKNKDNAIKCYKKVIELSKDDKQIFECYNKIIELEPNDADILYMLAFCYYHGKGCRKNHSESFDYCKKAKNLDIKYSNAWNNLRS